MADEWQINNRQQGGSFFCLPFLLLCHMPHAIRLPFVCLFLLFLPGIRIAIQLSFHNPLLAGGRGQPEHPCG
jgi:hypothetical protein